jgi:hypothetical protein
MESEARRFLEALFAEKPSDLYLLIWTLPDKQSYWFHNVEDAIQFVESLTAGQDIYVGVGLSIEDRGPYQRCLSVDVAGIVGVAADIDLRSSAHVKSALPGTIEEALSLLPANFPPTFIILTGNGIHAWWLFREPCIFQSEEERKGIAALANRWGTLIQDNARIRGWKIERLSDLARVLRIPGTMNYKDSANPKPVVTQACTDRRYNSSDLAEYLDDLGVPDAEAEENDRKQWAEQFQDTPLKIELHALIPEAQLDQWLASDPRFKNTWFRQRPDLKDQTQSGYDLALADFGFRAGLVAQDVVRLIIHHRRIHQQKARTKLDYFYRTLSKAAEQNEKPFRSRPSPEPAPFADTVEAASAAQNPCSGQRPKSDREKIDLCKRISAALGVELLRIVKLSGDDPLYRMDLVEGSISFSSVAKLISQPAVRTAIAGKVGILIPDIKRAAWRNLVQAMLDACIVEDGGEELESEGAACLRIRQYLGETTFIPGIGGQLPQDLRKPMVCDDQIAVCASDLQLYINKTGAQSISVPAVVAMLSAVGAKVERVRGNFKEQSRWMLPLDEFDSADYPSSMSGGSAEHA